MNLLSHYFEFQGAGHRIINQGIRFLFMMIAFSDYPSSCLENRCAKAMAGPAFVILVTDKGET